MKLVRCVLQLAVFLASGLESRVSKFVCQCNVDAFQSRQGGLDLPVLIEPVDFDELDYPGDS